MIGDRLDRIACLLVREETHTKVVYEVAAIADGEPRMDPSARGAFWFGTRPPTWSAWIPVVVLFAAASLMRRQMDARA